MAKRKKAAAMGRTIEPGGGRVIREGAQFLRPVPAGSRKVWQAQADEHTLSPTVVRAMLKRLDDKQILEVFWEWYDSGEAPQAMPISDDVEQMIAAGQELYRQHPEWHESDAQ